VREEDAALMTSGEVKRIEAKVRKSRVYDREKETLARLAAFNSNQPKKAPASATNKPEDGDERTGRAGVSRFVPQGLYYMEENEDEEDDASDWKSHKLAFVPESRNDVGSYAADVNDYEVHDPLLEKGKGKKFAKK
jgi:peptidyl-prolyl cis-trans isomerase SDCCAG10